MIKRYREHKIRARYFRSCAAAAREAGRHGAVAHHLMAAALHDKARRWLLLALVAAALSASSAAVALASWIAG